MPLRIKFVKDIEKDYKDVHHSIDIVALIEGILTTLDDSEYIELLKGILKRKELSSNKLMQLVAYFCNELRNRKLNPAQKNALKSYFKEFDL